jgi:hypothetical protein
MSYPQTLEGTGKELLDYLEQFPQEHFRLTPLPKPEEQKQRRPSALGKYAFVPGGSEEFAREKHAEIECEDRARV